MPPEADDLDIEGALNEALDQQAATPEQQVTEEAPAREYNRDDTGKFARKEAEEPAQHVTPDPAQQAQAQTDKAPLWFKNEWGEWEKLHPDFRKAAAQRERDYAQGIEKHATAAKAWEPINETLKPHMAELAAAGSSPQQYVGQLIEADKYLRADPIQALNWLAQQYCGAGWDIRALADWMDKEGVQAQRVDPVQQELTALKNKLAALEAAPQQQYQQSVNATISEWSKDKPYFTDLQSTIYGLIQADPSVRERFRVDPKATLDALYDRAQWSHPQIRERILEDQRKADVKRARDASLGTREQTYSNGQLKNTPKLSIEDEIGGLIDGMI